MEDSTPFVSPAQGAAAEQHTGTGLAPAPDMTATAQPLLVVINGNEQTIDPSALNDEAFAGDLLNTCKDAAEPPTFTLHHLLDWPDEQRWAVLRLLQGLSPYCLARATAEGAAQADIFAVVLSLLVGPADVTRCERGRRAAIEAVALLHGDALEPACTLITQRLKELGVKGVLPQAILKAARNVAGEADQGRRDPAAAARAFLAHLGEGAGLQQGTRGLHYYRDDFYEWVAAPRPWESGRWRRLSVEELKVRLTRFLQGGNQEEQVTQRYVGDVLANLRGLALLEAWGEEMPFLISGGGDGKPVVTRPPFLVFRNGMIDLDEAVECLAAGADATPTLYDVVPEYLNLTCLPYNYDPDAWCPLWEQTLDEILPRTSDGDRRREVLQEFMGWTLAPGDMRYQKFLILVGAGSNGKSTITGLWTELLGRDNVSHVPLSHLGGEFRLYEMAGKLANIAGDMTRLDKVEEGVLKQLTTGDPMQVNIKNRPPVTMRPTARLVFGTNALPPFSDRTDGVWRRMIALPFQEKIPADRVDPQRVRKLLEEPPGILNWALAGLARLYRQGRFTHCSECERCVAEHRHDSDPFQQFIDERVRLDPTLQVGAETLFRKYAEFCDANKRHPRGSSEFGKQVLALLGVTKHRETGGDKRPYYYRGLDLATDCGTG